MLLSLFNIYYYLLEFIGKPLNFTLHLISLGNRIYKRIVARLLYVPRKREFHEFYNDKLAHITKYERASQKTSKLSSSKWKIWKNQHGQRRFLQLTLFMYFHVTKSCLKSFNIVMVSDCFGLLPLVRWRCPSGNSSVGLC